ncbi:hypothetical protein JZX93_16280 [Acidomonas methanolica]|nr:hypothetical protein [Acidomonas methanolica]
MEIAVLGIDWGVCALFKGALNENAGLNDRLGKDGGNGLGDGPMGLLVRTIGLARTMVKIGAANTVHNMNRAIGLHGNGTSPPDPARSRGKQTAIPTTIPGRLLTCYIERVTPAHLHQQKTQFLEASSGSPSASCGDTFIQADKLNVHDGCADFFDAGQPWQ